MSPAVVLAIALAVGAAPAERATTKGGTRVEASVVSQVQPAAVALVIRAGDGHAAVAALVDVLADAARRSAPATQPVSVRVAVQDGEVALIIVAPPGSSDAAVRAADAALRALRAPTKRGGATAPASAPPAATLLDDVQDVVAGRPTSPADSAAPLALRADQVSVAIVAASAGAGPLARRAAGLLTAPLDRAAPAAGPPSLQAGLTLAAPLRALVVSWPGALADRAAIAVLAALLDGRVVRGGGAFGLATSLDPRSMLTDIAEVAPPDDVVASARARAGAARRADLDSTPRLALARARALADDLEGEPLDAELAALDAVTVENVRAAARALAAGTALVGAGAPAVPPAPPAEPVPAGLSPSVRVTHQELGLPITVVAEGALGGGEGPCGSRRLTVTHGGATLAITSADAPVRVGDALWLTVPFVPGVFSGGADVIAAAAAAALARARPAVPLLDARAVIVGRRAYVRIEASAAAEDVSAALRAYAADEREIKRLLDAAAARDDAMWQRAPARALRRLDEALCFGAAPPAAVSSSSLRAALHGPVVRRTAPPSADGR